MTRAEARNAHRAEARNARIVETLSTKPEECKICSRCKGARRLDAWAATGSVCAKCRGLGYELTPAMARAKKLTVARSVLADVTTRGLALKAQGPAFSVKAHERKLTLLRSQWVEATAAVRALA